ncbi:MAG: hypothetical protein ACYCR5_04615 [Leptospirillum sp.]
MDTLIRTVWACNGTAIYHEFETAKLNDREDIVKAYIANRICMQVRARTEIHVLSTVERSSGPEGELMVFRRKRHYEGLVTSKWYALSDKGKFRFVTGNTLREKKEGVR